VIEFVALLRPHQYIKNLFVLLPAFFAGRITDAGVLVDAILAFVSFSMSASAIYIVNDYFDIDHDREHPTKKNRPLASGAIAPRAGLIAAAVLAVGSALLMAVLSIQALVVLLVYVTMNIAYSARLKHIALIDVCIIAVGFVLRLFVGSFVTDTPLSSWIVMMTFLLALFLALGKRRSDTLIFLSTGQRVREVIDGYNLQLVDTAMAIMSSVVIVAYLLYTKSEEVMERLHNEYLYLTTGYVILGILRYLQVTLVQEASGSPTRIVLKDRFLQFTLLAWGVSFAWIIYA